MEFIFSVNSVSWNAEAIRRQYRTIESELEDSAARLPVMEAKAAMAECFLIGGEAIRRIVDSDHDLVVACYSGERGHPVKLARRHWAEAIAVAQGDEGARRLLRGREDVVLVEVGDVAAGYDVDVRVE